MANSCEIAKPEKNVSEELKRRQYEEETNMAITKAYNDVISGIRRIEIAGKEYRIKLMGENYWRTEGGRAYIRKEDGAYIIFAANGNRKGIRKTFEDAIIKAYEV